MCSGKEIKSAHIVSITWYTKAREPHLLNFQTYACAYNIYCCPIVALIDSDMITKIRTVWFSLQLFFPARFDCTANYHLGAGRLFFIFYRVTRSQ